MKRIAFLIVLLSLTLAPTASFAYSSGLCAAATCTSGEVGEFMQGISKQCANLGDCTLDDIMLLFVNTGNFVVGIIGALVLLMYVVGGFYWLTSGGSSARVEKGKKFMTISTIGLLIVMFSYIGIFALRGTLESGNAYIAVEYNACADIETNGDACNLNSTCVDGLCLSACEQTNDNTIVDESPGQSVIQSVGYKCVDVDNPPEVEGSRIQLERYTGCQPNLCAGGKNIQCCTVHAYR